MTNRKMRQEENYLSHVDKELLNKINQYKKEGKRFNEKDLSERMNSYEWNLVLPLLTNEDLIKNAEYYIKQSFGEFRKTNEYTLESTYNETLKHKIIHLLIERLREGL